MTATQQALQGRAVLFYDEAAALSTAFQIINADGTYPDISGWTFKCEVWDKVTDEGGSKIATINVSTSTTATVVLADGVTTHTGAGSVGIGVLTASLAVVQTLKSGYLIELLELTPTAQPWMRAVLRVQPRVIV